MARFRKATGGANADALCISPSISTHGFVALACRLAFSARHEGGLSQLSDKAAAIAYLESLLRPLLSGPPWSLRLFVGGAQWRPPRPLDGHGPRALPIDKEGRADLSAIFHQPSARILGMLAQLEKTLGALARDSCKVPLLDFMLAFGWVQCSKKEVKLLMQGLFMHAALSISDRLDTIVVDIAEGRRREERDLQVFRPDLHNRLDRNRLSMSYWQEVMKASEHHLDAPHNFTADFSLIAKRNIMDCAIVWPSGVGGWLPCQDFGRGARLLISPH